ncbi:hypothetical protein DFH09DRAFT_1354580 [Mycena vulgaris]|nr:hypothetical protein DFH09DRAFT_1354580 [Mycena vulgaris]
MLKQASQRSNSYIFFSKREVFAYDAESEDEGMDSENGASVAVKIISQDLHLDEANIFKYFSSKELASDPRNHCIPLLSVLSPPDDDDKLILVMKLMRQHDRPRFDTFGEVMEFFRQAFEGIQSCTTIVSPTGNDCTGYNIMMDGQHLFPYGFHPRFQDMKPDNSETAKHYTRTQRPVKYYIIDFGLSRKFQEGEVPRTYIIEGGDSSPPEFGTIQERVDSAIPHKLLDPFPTDIYYLGNMIRRNYLDGVPVLKQTAKFGFEFMRPLVSDMVQDDPAKRPTIDEVVARFDEIRAGLSSWKLRSRVVKKSDFRFNIPRILSHWVRRVGYIVMRVPAIPTPKP